MKKIMILGASILQLPAIKKAKEMGLVPVVVDMNPNAIGFEEQGIVKEVISTIDKDGVLAAAKRNKIDGIITIASDMPMQTVAFVASKMGLIGIDEDTALKATNKASMRDALKSHGVPIPMYYKVNTRDEFDSAVHSILDAGYKCIIKPADNSGSKGIDLLQDTNQETLENAFKYGKNNSRGGCLMVEEYMEGPEVSVETLAFDGQVHVIQITDKLTTGAPYFVEMGHNEPSLLPETIKKEISKVAIEANHAIGITNGPSHTEIKVTKDGPKVVELGARLGGDCITTHLVPLSTGVDIVKCCIDIALGEAPDISIRWDKGAAIRYFRQHAGIVENISGIEKAEISRGIIQISVVHGIGESITEINNSGSRMGFVIAQDINANQAITDCEQALDMISVKIQ